RVSRPSDPCLQTLACKSHHPCLLQTNHHTLHQNRNGHPTDAEAPGLNGVEDRLTAALRQVTGVQYAGRVTTKGARELVYYVKDADKANKLLTQLATAKQVRAWA